MQKKVDKIFLDKKVKKFTENKKMIESKQVKNE